MDDCLKENDLLQEVHNICKKNGLTTVCNNTKVDIQDELKNGLLRPNVKDFVEFCDTKYKNAEVFLYTNSSYAWANDAIVPNIEKVAGFKINKPIFTRENSLKSMKKSVSNIYKDIVATLIHKYPTLKTDKNIETTFKNRMILIDDIENNLYDLSSRQIVCPEYEAYTHYDIVEKLINKYKIPAEVFNDKDLLKFMGSNFISIYNKNGDIYQQSKEIAKIRDLLYSEYDKVSKSKPDTFFNDLISRMKATTITDKVIVNINKHFKV